MIYYICASHLSFFVILSDLSLSFSSSLYQLLVVVDYLFEYCVKNKIRIQDTRFRYRKICLSTSFLSHIHTHTAFFDCQC